MSRVLVNHLNVRAGPSTNSAKVTCYDPGQIINIYIFYLLKIYYNI